MNAAEINLAELAAKVEQQAEEIRFLQNMLELERTMRRNSNARLIAAGGAMMAKVDELDRYLNRRAA